MESVVVDNISVNFVSVNNRILTRIANNLARHIKNSTVSKMMHINSDVNVFINAQLNKRDNYIEKDSGKTITMGLYTHSCNNNQIESNFDWNFSMNNEFLKYLPKDNSSILPLGVDDIFIKDRLVLGFCGREYHKTNRKRFSWIERIRMIDKRVDVVFTNGEYKQEDLPDFFKSIDYLVVTSSIEGGPFPVIESLAIGKPVIAPNVGWCWEYPVIKYDGTYDDLERIIKKILSIKTGYFSGAMEIIKTYNQIKKKTI